MNLQVRWLPAVRGVAGTFSVQEQVSTASGNLLADFGGMQLTVPVNVGWESSAGQMLLSLCCGGR